MNGRAFKLGTFARPSGEPFAAIVLGDEVVDLTRAYEIYRASAQRNALTSTNGILDLLQNWDTNFPVLQEIVAFLDKEGLKPRAGMSPAGGPRFTGEKSTTRPYLFLKAPSCLAGAYDDIQIPLGMSKIDWEAEIALAIGKKGKRIKAERALEHIAGFMTTNDVSCRDLQIRADRPALRSDWLGGKSHDNFAPMGPFLVPRAFVPDHTNLFIRLTVNGEVKQNGNTSQFIFTPEEQIEYASGILTLEPGDIFSCGTCGGVGQGANTFLKLGDVMETEVESLGKMQNRFVAETS